MTFFFCTRNSMRRAGVKGSCGNRRLFGNEWFKWQVTKSQFGHRDLQVGRNISYLLLYNKLPPILSAYNSKRFVLHSFCGSVIWEWLNSVPWAQGFWWNCIRTVNQGTVSSKAWLRCYGDSPFKITLVVGRPWSFTTWTSPYSSYSIWHLTSPKKKDLGESGRENLRQKRQSFYNLTTEVKRGLEFPW